MAKQHQTVEITGASAGVGRATAREFAKHGARIALLASIVGHNPSRLVGRDDDYRMWSVSRV